MWVVVTPPLSARLDQCGVPERMPSSLSLAVWAGSGRTPSSSPPAFSLPLPPPETQPGLMHLLNILECKKTGNVREGGEGWPGNHLPHKGFEGLNPPSQSGPR